MRRDVPAHEAIWNGHRLRVIGAMPSDEVHTGTITGTVNVAQMWLDIESMRVPFPVACRSVVIDELSLLMLKNQDLDQEQLARVTPERAAKACIGIAQPDGTHCLVDGSHRLHWRHVHGYPNFQMYDFPPEAMLHYRVRMRFKPRGSQIWRDMTPEEILGASVGKYPILDDAGRLVGRRVDQDLRENVADRFTLAATERLMRREN